MTPRGAALLTAVGVLLAVLVALVAGGSGDGGVRSSASLSPEPATTAVVLADLLQGQPEVQAPAAEDAGPSVAWWPQAPVAPQEAPHELATAEGSAPAEATVEGEAGDSTPTGYHAPSTALPVAGSTLEAAALAATGDAAWARSWAAVSQCESRGDVYAVGAAGERGPAQIHPVHGRLIESLGYTWAQMFEPVANAAVSYAIWRSQGWSAWSHCSRAAGVA